MSKSKKKSNPQKAKLPKNALAKISLGDSFAEYDMLVDNNDVFVTTNAYQAASDP